MPFHYPFNNCKANTRAFEILHFVKTLKDSEKLIAVLHVKPNAIVFHIKNSIIRCRIRTYFKQCLFLLARIL